MKRNIYILHTAQVKMNREDIIYLCSLFFSMGFGVYYRTIQNTDYKKKVGALVGLSIVFVVSGLHSLHVLISIFITACIILYTDKRKCHIYTFASAFVYLLFFRTTGYFGIPYPPSHTNLVQMMLTLKLVGMAFEVNSSYTSKAKRDGAKKTEEEEQLEGIVDNLEFMDVFYYSLNYCGVLAGPYYRYKTYLDHLYKPYHQYDNYKKAVLDKVHLVPLLGGIYLITNHYWPLSYVYTDEFLNRSFLYRYWYIWPIYLVFRSRLYFGLVLTEIVCITSGFGVYPEFSKTKSGHGPTENFKKLKELKDPGELKKLEYSYKTTTSLDLYEAEFTPTMRESMKNWNKTVQYWLATYVYKRFPNKKYRVHVTFFMSAAWHGIYPGYYFSIGIVPFTLIFEDVWVKLVLKDNTGLSLTIFKLVTYFLKMQMFSYQTTAFMLQEIGKIMNYYNCVYHCVPILYIGLYFLAQSLLQRKVLKEQKIKQENGRVQNGEQTTKKIK